MSYRFLNRAPWLRQPRFRFSLFAVLGFVVLALVATAVGLALASDTPEAVVSTPEATAPQTSEPALVQDPITAPSESALAVPTLTTAPELNTTSNDGASSERSQTTVAKQAQKPDAKSTTTVVATSQSASSSVTTPVAVSGSVSVSNPASVPEVGPSPQPEPSLPSSTKPSPEPTAPSTSATSAPPPASGWTGLPANGSFDYQIGGDYSLPPGTSIVSRDWFSGQAAGGAYSICYVNAFQTQPDGSGNRPDELSRWPSDLVLRSLGDDPNWDGEYLIDLSSDAKRVAAAQWVAQMIDQCAAKGFDAVEFDNLDSWTRLNSLPFGQSEALAYAKMITDYSHAKGLAAGQKNTAEIIAAGRHRQVGFDFAIAEQCGQYNECDVYVEGYGNALIIIEYDRSVFNRTCSQFGTTASVVLRDVLVRTPERNGYVYEGC